MKAAGAGTAFERPFHRVGGRFPDGVNRLGNRFDEGVSMLDGLKILVIAAAAFWAGMLCRGAIEHFRKAADPVSPAAERSLHLACGDLDGVRYLFEEVP